MITITMTNCKFCHKDIEWRKENGKYVPYNIDGTQHTRQQCEQMQKLVSASQGNRIDDVRETLAKVLKNENDELRFRIGEYEGTFRKVV